MNRRINEQRRESQCVLQESCEGEKERNNVIYVVV